MIVRIAPAVVVVAIAIAGCGDAGLDQACRVGADCASGVCLADGTCEAISVVDGEPGAGDPDAAVSCGDHDGILTRAEVPLEPAQLATFRVGLDSAVSSAGVVNPDSSRTWELHRTMAGDHDVAFETLPIADTWFASAFPTASFAARISDDPDLLGVYRATASALLLQGVVSTADGWARTELTYDPPVELMRFPVVQGASWSALANVSGLVGGFASAYSERYDVGVDASGIAVTPAGAFPVLRIGTVLTRTVGLAETVVRRYQFASECVGFVGTLVSNADEPDVEFTTAAEVWRLGV